MKILSSRILFAGLLMLGLSATLLMQPAQSFLTAQQPVPRSSETVADPFQGVWVGKYQFIAGDGQIQLYINPAGNLYGNYVSNDGAQFAQISGEHRGNAFHIVFTPPPGTSIHNVADGGHDSRVLDATSNFEGSDQFTISGDTPVGHSYNYTFTRMTQDLTDHQHERENLLDAMLDNPQTCSYIKEHMPDYTLPALQICN